MNQPRLKSADDRLPCSDLNVMAERELSAFFHTVTELFGREQAAIAAEDWLRELEDSENLPASRREWRFITARVSARVANCVNTSSRSNQSETLRRERVCVFSSQAPQDSLDLSSSKN